MNFVEAVPMPKEDEIHFTDVSDGWRLALHRYRGEGSRGEPVLLHHGLGASGALFDLGLDDAPSLARWLAEQGYDVWACDMRGSGMSECPGASWSKQWEWSVDDCIEKDNPAIVETILRQSDYDELHWVGHSLGGILLLCYCCLHGSPRLASGVAVAAGLEYTGHSGYRYIRPLRSIGRLLKQIPSGQMSKVIAPLCGRVPNGLEAFNCHAPNTSPKVTRAIYAGVSNDVTGEALNQLATLFEPGGLRSTDGMTTYTQLAGNIDTPILMMSGDADMQCSSGAIERTHRMLPGDKHRLLRFGRQHGHVEDYGHYDLLNGLRADDEVYPGILDWLRSHPAARAH